MNVKQLLAIVAIFAISGKTVVESNGVHYVPIQRRETKVENLIRLGKFEELARIRRLNSEIDPLIYKAYYNGEIIVGTPGVTFSVNMDTGGVLVALASTLCPNCVLFESGILIADKVCIGTSLCYQNQTLLQITNNTYGLFNADISSGILGLSYPFGIGQPYQFLLASLLPQLSQPIFTVWLNDSVPRYSSIYGGAITFGGLDTTHCSSTVNYVPCISYGWTFIMSGISIGKYSYNASWTVTSDSGAPGIYVSSAVYAIITQLRDKFPGLEDQKFPPFVFTIGGKQYSVPSSIYFNFNVYNSGSDWILGAPFMRFYCHVHNIATHQIGFAQVLGPPTTTTTTTTTPKPPPTNCKCTGLCAELNFNRDSIVSVSTNVTINGIHYYSRLHTPTLAQCDRPNIIDYPATSDSSVLNNLVNGQFVGILQCPIGVCICADRVDNISDCYRGDSSVQLLLIPFQQSGIATASCMLPLLIAFFQMYAIVEQGILSRPGSSITPTVGAYPSLAAGVYLQVHHLACVTSTTASNADVCPSAQY